MVIKTSLTSHLQLASACFQLSAQLPGSQGGLSLQGALVPGAQLDFTAMVDHLLGAGYLQLPADFPSLSFDTAAATMVPGQGIAIRATSAQTWNNPFGILEGVDIQSFALAF